jgi:Leucine-rich repeat (LRR) protein
VTNLKECSQLRTLDLKETKVSDTALEHIKGLTQLQSLSLTDTNVTDDGVKKLRQALPTCRIER